MRLKRLRLRNYGCFAALDLPFATAPGRVTMVVAPNGTGKSVLRRAFHDLLFDIPLQSPMKFRHGYPGMSLHAEAVDGDGTAFGFGWERGGKPPRVTTDPARFAALRQGVTSQQLERLFALDTAGLRDGGTDLKGATTLAGALLAGTGELAPARTVQAALEARRNANWGQGRSKPPLNAAAARLLAERRRAREAVQRPDRREREERDLRDRQEALEAAQRARNDAAADARRLHRIALTRPFLRQLADARAWFAANPDMPALPAGLDVRLAAARGAVATAQAARDGAAVALARARHAAGAIGRDPAATALADELRALPGLLGEAEKTGKDIAERRVEHAARLDDVRVALRAVGASVPERQAGDVIPTLGLMAEARAAITAEAGLRKALDLAEDALNRTRDARTLAEAAPAAAAALPAGLAVLLAEIRADRANPGQHAAELAAATRAATARTRRLLALLPGWAGTMEALRGLALPPEGTFERLDATRLHAAAAHHAARAHLAELEAQAADARASLDALRAHDLPDTARIAAARAARDRGLRLVLRHAFATPPGADEDRAYAGEEPVALVFERQVQAADALADLRLVELARVGEAERLHRLLADLDSPLAQGRTAVAEAAAGFAAADRSWAQAVAPLGLDGQATMTELRRALAGRTQAIDAASEEDVAAGTEAALTAVHAAWADRLGASLGAAPAPLAALLSQADGQIAVLRAAEQDAARRQAALDAAGRALRDAIDAHGKAHRALAGWQEGWAGLLERLHRPPGETPEAVAAVLGGMTVLDRHHRDAVSLGRRIDAMADDLDGFAALVGVLAERLGGVAATGAPAGVTPAAVTPASVARACIARAASAMAAESAWRQARLGQDQAEAAATAAEAELRAALDGLAAVAAACGAETATEAEGRIACSRAHAEHVAQRDAACAGLAEHGDDLPEATLHADADAVPADEMAARRQRAEDEAAAAAARAEVAAVRFHQLRDVLDAEAGATAAVDSRADYEAAVAEFGRRLEEQLVLNLASAMLGDAMRSVEEAAGGSSLVRVSQAFAAVTDGAYGLQTQDGAAGEELHAVELAHPAERKSLDELSEGTRDQLYLALRLVALQDHCAAATPLPFIADDILQTFDDRRAAATLRALAGLAEATQVIVLTHHDHLARLAAGLGGGCVEVVRL